MIFFCRIKLFLIITCSSLIAGAQTVLLEEYPAKDTIPKIYGKNLNHFSHFYAGFGFAADNTKIDSVKINYGLSANYFIGIRYKRKISNYYAIGYDASLSVTNFNIRQNSNKNFLDTLQYTKEKYHYTSLSLELYNRVNFGKRGNAIGKYIDAGIYGEWVFSNYHYTKTPYPENTTTNHGKYIETKTRKNNFTEPFIYGIKLRLGVNRWTIFTNYRLSNMFVSSHKVAELPRLFTGIQIGFF